MAVLLPPNSTQLERRFSQQSEQALNLPVQISALGDVENVPEQFLSYVAWQNSVDRWDDTWPTTIKRHLIKDSFNTHQIKGTIASLRKIAAAWGFSINILEWWQTTPQGEPGTFSLDIVTNGQTLTASIYNVLMQLMQEATPLTRHLTALQLKVEPIPVLLNTCACICDGIETILYPYVPDLTAQMSTTVVMYDEEQTILYPSTP